MREIASTGVAVGPVAQWLEPAAHNGLVGGSSPSRPTTYQRSTPKVCCPSQISLPHNQTHPSHDDRSLALSRRHSHRPSRLSHPPQPERPGLDDPCGMARPVADPDHGPGARDGLGQGPRVDRSPACHGREPAMTYSLIQLAPGAYDLLLGDTIVASVVRSGLRQPYIWTAELLEDLPRSRRPAPFREVEHSFPSLEELCAWLGQPAVRTNNRGTTSQGA